jgi:hypothetical protein
MQEAFALYKRFGFSEIPAYYHNPVPGVSRQGADPRDASANRGR